MRPRTHCLPMYIEEFNKVITDGRYLFTDIAKEDLDRLNELIDHLLIVTEKFCLETITEHERKVVL